MAHSGSVPIGPSQAYLRLLKREITPEDYAKIVKERLSKDQSGVRVKVPAQSAR